MSACIRTLRCKLALLFRDGCTPRDYECVIGSSAGLDGDCGQNTTNATGIRHMAWVTTGEIEPSLSEHSISMKGVYLKEVWNCGRKTISLQSLLAWSARERSLRIDPFWENRAALSFAAPVHA